MMNEMSECSLWKDEMDRYADIGSEIAFDIHATLGLIDLKEKRKTRYLCPACGERIVYMRYAGLAGEMFRVVKCDKCIKYYLHRDCNEDWKREIGMRGMIERLDRKIREERE